MKIDVIIFSFFILMLALHPCSDVETCNDENSTELADLSHDHSEDEGDDCTPFCACQCCGTFISIVDLPNYTSKSLYSLTTLQVVYNFNYSFDELKLLWRPPAFV